MDTKQKLITRRIYEFNDGIIIEYQWLMAVIVYTEAICECDFIGVFSLI